MCNRRIEEARHIQAKQLNSSYDASHGVYKYIILTNNITHYILHYTLKSTLLQYPLPGCLNCLAPELLNTNIFHVNHQVNQSVVATRSLLVGTEKKEAAQATIRARMKSNASESNIPVY